MHMAAFGPAFGSHWTSALSLQSGSVSSVLEQTRTAAGGVAATTAKAFDDANEGLTSSAANVSSGLTRGLHTLLDNVIAAQQSVFESLGHAVPPEVRCDRLFVGATTLLRLDGSLRVTGRSDV